VCLEGFALKGVVASIGRDPAHLVSESKTKVQATLTPPGDRLPLTVLRKHANLPCGAACYVLLTYPPHVITI
jgi:hypothetical protein